MADIMTVRAREALVQVLTAAAPRWNQDVTKIRFLSGPPLLNTDLPGISITFPVFRVRTAGIGGLTGIEAKPASPPRSLIALRLEGTARFDVWVARDATGAPSLDQTDKLAKFISEALTMGEVPLRQAGIYRWRQSGFEEIRKAEEIPAWTFRGQGFQSSITGELIFEAAFPPDVAEGIINTVDVTLNGPGTAKFSIR